jgi:hypothetical protein
VKPGKETETNGAKRSPAQKSNQRIDHMEDQLRKKVSADRTYIDYTRGNYGVRVRTNQAQRIVLSGSNWLHSEGLSPLPINDDFQDLTKGKKLSTSPALALEIARIDDDELTKLTRGEISLEEALGMPRT